MPATKPPRDESGTAADSSATPCAGLGSVMADWSERWFPDAFVFALLAVLVVFVAGLAAGSSIADLVRFFGEGFWSLIPFTMQMVMVIVGGYVVASSPPVYRLIRWLAGIPATPRGARLCRQPAPLPRWPHYLEKTRQRGGRGSL